METFQSLGLPKELERSLEEMSFTVPTPIQAQAIPVALLGSDVIGIAQTGTGKTAAFSIPLLTHLLNNPKSHGLVITPTRELAMQVLQMIEKLLGKRSAIRTALLIGGKPIYQQFKQLSSARLIVGTPGRINDHLERQSLDLSDCSFLVLDEADRMLDMGFGIQLQAIAEYLPKERQTLMFSATLPANILKLASVYLKKDAVKIAVEAKTVAADKIKQEVVHTSEVEKYGVLLDQLKQHNGTCIIFVKTKFGTEKLAKKLRTDGFTAEPIHGDMRQKQRENAIQDFRDLEFQVLVATDIASRGLDISHVERVINYDLPQCTEDYFHRIGRTGRAGADGVAISLVTNQDKMKWRDICRLNDPAAAALEKSDRSEGSRSGGSWSNRNRGGNGRPRRYGNDDSSSRFGDGSNGGGGERRRYGNSEGSSSRFGGNGSGTGDRRRSGGNSSAFGGNSNGSGNRRRSNGEGGGFGGGRRRSDNSSPRGYSSTGA